MPPPRSKSAKKATPLDLAREEAVALQQEIEALTEEVRCLREELERKAAEVERLSGKLNTILPEILSHRDQQKFPLEPLENMTGRPTHDSPLSLTPLLHPVYLLYVRIC